MASEPLGRFVRYFRQRLVVNPVDGANDGQLVERFARQNDESAFDALMQRHGPMVLSVCRRVLRRDQDVEDAFQATFLVLVRDAGSIRNRASVGSWLYHVAYRLALRLRADIEGHARPERREDTRRPVPPEVEAAWRELQAVLDEELARLPEKYRAPLVLCYLEGKTHEEAARHLRWPAGTVKGRLARARELLSRRLTRRGLAPGVGSIAVALAANTPSAAVPIPLVTAARNAVLSGGGGRAAGAASPRVVALADGHARALLLAMLKNAAVVVLAATLLAGAAGLFALWLWGGNPSTDPPENAPFLVASPTVPPSAPRARTDLLGDALPQDALARLGTVRLRVGAPVYNFAFSSDGRILAAGGERSILIWSATTGEEIRQLTGHQSRVMGVAFSPDGRLVASGSADRTIRLWNIDDGTEVRRFEGHEGTVGRVLFSPDGRSLVSGGGDKTVRLWDVATGRELRQFGEKGGLPSATVPIAFLPDNRTVATWAADGRLLLWDAATGKELPATEWLPKRVSAAAVAPDGTTLATVSVGAAAVQLWEVATRKELGQLRGHRGAVDAVAFSLDGKTLASSGAEATIRLWEVATTKELRCVPTGQYQRSGLVFSPNLTLASGLDTTIRLWNAATGEELQSFAGHLGPVRAVAFLSDGRSLVSAGPDRTVRIWEATGKELGRWEGPGQDPGALAFAVAPNGNLLACGSLDRSIHLRKVDTGELVRQWRGHTELVSALAFSPDGETLVSGSWDGSVGVWDSATGKERRRLQGHRQEVLAVAVSPDGQLVASAGTEGIVFLWDLATGAILRKFEGKLGWVRSVAFSPDGKTLAVASGIHATRGSRGLLSLWDVATGEERCRWGAHGERAYCVTFSPDGVLLASGGGDQKIRFWESATGNELSPLEGHRGAVVSIAFAPDGRTIASGSMDTTVLIWPIKNQPSPPP